MNLSHLKVKLSTGPTLGESVSALNKSVSLIPPLNKSYHCITQIESVPLNSTLSEF